MQKKRLTCNEFSWPKSTDACCKISKFSVLSKNDSSADIF